MAAAAPLLKSMMMRRGRRPFNYSSSCEAADYYISNSNSSINLHCSSSSTSNYSISSFAAAGGGPPPPTTTTISSSCCCCNATSSSRRRRMNKKIDHTTTTTTTTNLVLVQEEEEEEEEDVDKNNSSTTTSSNDYSLWPLLQLKERILSFVRRIKRRRSSSLILLNFITIVYVIFQLLNKLKNLLLILTPSPLFALLSLPFHFSLLSSTLDTIPKLVIPALSWVSGLAWVTFSKPLVFSNSDAGRASFIAMFTVLVVPFLDSMLLGSTIPARTWFGALISLIGVALLESTGSPPSIGDLLNFLSAVSFGIHMLRTEHISRITKPQNFFPLLGYQICVVAVLSTLWYFIQNCFPATTTIQRSNPFSWTSETVVHWILSFPWIPALYTGFFSTSLCLWVEISAMRDVSATETAIIYGLEPVWGAAFAWCLLGERWGVSGWIGAALVLVQIMGAKSDSSISREFKSGIAETKDFLIPK